CGSSHYAHAPIRPVHGRAHRYRPASDASKHYIGTRDPGEINGIQAVRIAQLRPEVHRRAGVAWRERSAAGSDGSRSAQRDAVRLEGQRPALQPRNTVDHAANGKIADGREGKTTEAIACVAAGQHPDGIILRETDRAGR